MNSHIQVSKNLTLVFSSTTLSPSADTHRTALTAFFPVFQEKAKGGERDKHKSYQQSHSTQKQTAAFRRSQAQNGVQDQEGDLKSDAQIKLQKHPGKNKPKASDTYHKTVRKLSKRERTDGTKIKYHIPLRAKDLELVSSTI